MNLDQAKKAIESGEFVSRQIWNDKTLYVRELYYRYFLGFYTDVFHLMSEWKLINKDKATDWEIYHDRI